jgi:CheY-like chemotaxis protein
MREAPLDPRHPCILAVDDDLDTRELYQIVLESVGYRVALAGSVRVAAETISRTAPHVVLTDWRLPDGDGFDVCRAVRSDVRARHAPIIAVTGISMQPPALTEARERGFTSVLLKPVLPEDILRAVRGATEIAAARRLRAAARRLLRYAQSVRYAKGAGGGQQPIDTAVLTARAASKSGEDIALVLADDRAHYVAAAGSTRQLTGYEPQELLSLSVWDLTPTPTGIAGQGLWESFIASGTQEGRYTLRRRDGVAVEAQYCAIANVVPGLHVSALAEATQIPASF